MEPTTTSDGGGDVATKPVESLTTRPVAKVDDSVDLDAEVVFDMNDVSVLYGDFRAVRGATLKIRKHQITAFIGPSGCGKTTILRCLNRMNDFIPTAKVEGSIKYHGVDLYDPAVNSTEVRRRIGMVFQKPNPFPKSIYDNVAYGPRLAGMRKRAELDDDRGTLAARRRTVGRGQGPPQVVRRSACPAVSNSGSASHGPWRSALT